MLKFCLPWCEPSASDTLILWGMKVLNLEGKQIHPRRWGGKHLQQKHISTWDKGLHLAYEGKPLWWPESKWLECHVFWIFSIYEAALELFLKCRRESIKLTFGAKEDKLEGQTTCNLVLMDRINIGFIEKQAWETAVRLRGMAFNC